METVLDQTCGSCGSDRLADGGFCLFCGDLLSQGPNGNSRRSQSSKARPDAGQDPSIADAFEYAGFWLRFWAGTIDVAIEAVAALVLTIVIDLFLRRFGHLFGIDLWDLQVFTGVGFIVILAVGGWLYAAFMESSSWRATIGKRLLGLQVMTIEGERTTFGTATVRHFMKYLSFFILTIGFLMSGWTKRRQALHDLPLDVLVVRVPEPHFTLLGR
jgi:uncharacterized RDD family membrane protein YckC